MHAIVDEVVGPNIVKKQLAEYDEHALCKILEILREDGIF
jgi:hypothetical protein